MKNEAVAQQSHVEVCESSQLLQLGWSVMLIIAAPCVRARSTSKNPSKRFFQPVRLSHQARQHASSNVKAARQSHVKADESSLGFQLGWSVLLVMATVCFCWV